MTDEERAALTAAVDRDIDQILRACVPLDWKGGDFVEAKEATGCLHPLTSIFVQIEGQLSNPIAKCKDCDTILDHETVMTRVRQAKQS